MQRKKIRKSFAIFMIALIFCWSSLPSVSMAFFIKPGQAIQPGEAITPGTPISGGQFIIPGDPINGGKSYQPGSIYQGGIAPVSGQPIIPGNHIKIGQFIIPNIAGNLPYHNNWLVTGKAMTNGKTVTPGNHITGGNATSGGSGLSGTVPSTGGNITGEGTSLSSGEGVEDGTGPSTSGPLTGGNVTGEGTSLSGGTGAEGGIGPSTSGPLPGGNTTDGTGAEGGNIPSTGGSLTGGNTTSGGTSTSGGVGPEGSTGPSTGGTLTNDNTTGGETSTSGGTSNSNSSPASFVESAFTWGKNLKKVVFTVPNYFGEMLDGSLSMWAGFNITDLKTAKGNKNLFQVNGRATAINGNSKLATYLNMRYSTYLKSFENSKAVVKATANGSVAVKDKSGKIRNSAIFQPRNDSPLRQKRIQGFLDEVTSFKSVLNKTKSYMKKNWLPLEKGGLNKNFFKSSTLAKGNGLANIALSVGYRISQNAADTSRTGTALAAGITTDVLLGAGQTAVSAGAGWSAVVIASSFGSVVPGLGTLVGAVIGLGIALALSTNTGKRFSRKVESIVKSGIVKLKNSKLGKGLKGLFGG